MVLLSEGQAYALLYLSLLKKLVRLDTIQYILVMVSDALLGAHSILVLARSGANSPHHNPEHEERIPLFLQTSESDPELPYGPLLK